MDEKNPPSLPALVDDSTRAKSGRHSFKVAMKKMGLTSVFDIIRLSRQVFAAQLSQYSDADAGQAYDNAMSYAVQIARQYREHQTSSGQGSSAGQRTGVRSLVSIGASYQNLFKENWDDFCSVGAIAAIDSPVAYLSRLYNFAGELEATPLDPDLPPRALLDKRRPDLKDLLIDQDSTFTPLPMLDLVNDILGKTINAHLASTPDKNKDLYEVLASRRYPFEFPYNLHHQQCVQGLTGSKPRLGELNLRISLKLPLSTTASDAYGRVQQDSAIAQQLMSGLGPEQQQLLTQEAPFTTFYLALNDFAAGQPWASPAPEFSAIHTNKNTSFLLPKDQPGVGVVTPQADAPGSGSGNTTVPLTFNSATNPDKPVEFFLNSNRIGSTGGYVLNQTHPASSKPANMSILLKTALEPNIADGYRVSFQVQVDRAGARVAQHSFTLTLDEHLSLNAQEQAFFATHYGASELSITAPSLTDANEFMHRTALNSEQLERLLAQRRHFPRLSANVPSKNPASPGAGYSRGFPHSSHYGACYVNGAGSGNYDTATTPDATSIQNDQYDNAMALVPYEVGDHNGWRITKTSPDRLDRMQRMIRLQRWTQIPFTELDTLLISAIRAESPLNLGLQLTANTLRALGLYQYLSRRYPKLAPEEFAAFLHDLTPYNTDDRLPLFDQVFNRLQVFDTPLVLDQTPFALDATPAAQKTLLQLAAGLGLQPAEDSLLLLARQTLADFKALTRDLTTVSSLYRQARIGQMFSLSPADTLGLAQVLGGDAYRSHLSRGTLADQATAGSTDILDVLLQMDWALGWLREIDLSVPRLRHLLGLDRDKTPISQELAQRLLQLHDAAAQAVLTPQELAALALPAKEDGAGTPAINWFNVLLDEKGGAAKKPLIDRKGLFLALPLASDVPEHFETALVTVVGRLTLADAVKAQAVQTLKPLVIAAHDRQQQLIEGLLQETLALPKQLTPPVLAWAKDSVHDLLLSALFNDGSLNFLYSRVARHGEAALALQISQSTLRLFLLHPTWLGASGYNPPATQKPALAELYLLERFGHWQRSQPLPEATLLSYFVLANPPAAELKNKQLRANVAENANAALAYLLAWNEQEVAQLTDLLASKHATSMADVDWVRRCQATCLASGLSTSGLLAATALTPQSAFTDWKKVGQAVIAAASAPQPGTLTVKE